MLEEFQLPLISFANLSFHRSTFTTQEPAKSKAAARESMFYNKAVGLGDKTAVSSLFPKQA